jgi:hypothetical protein
MKLLFLGFLVFASVIFSKNQNDIHEAQINLSGVFHNQSKKLVNSSSFQNTPSVLDNYSYIVQQMTASEKQCQWQYQMSLQQKVQLLSHG